jgi:hypothetical protein
MAAKEQKRCYTSSQHTLETKNTTKQLGQTAHISTQIDMKYITLNQALPARLANTPGTHLSNGMSEWD